jgi:multidrug efflux pump subunit AcrA (membrane-fusion protein)
VGWGPLTVALLLVLAAGAGVYFYLQRRNNVATVAVTRGTVVRAFYATGVVRPDFEYLIKSKAQGALVGFDKREGSHVSKGERIARVDDKALKFEVERLTAEVAEARKQAAEDSPQRTEVVARLNEAKQQEALARENLERTQQSFDRRAANFTDLDAARRTQVQWVNTIAALESQLGTWRIASQRALEVAEANLRKAQANLAEADVISPIDGILLERYVENQEVVGINQKLVLIAAPDDMLMKAAVDEEDVTRTRIGQKVEMQLYAFQNRDDGGKPRIFQGKVTEILPSANLTNKTYEVKVAFTERPALLRVGMTGELNFIEEESGLREALILPTSAVLDKKVYRERTGGIGKSFEAVPVEIGVRTLDKVEIRSGLSEGDRVVLDAKQVAPVKLPPQKQPVVPTRTGDEVAGQ